MKLSVSNIAWSADDDSRVYDLMKELGFCGLEIAPTRIFPESPYDSLSEIADFAGKIKEEYGFSICSMQSIWYGRQEKIFGTDEERDALCRYTQKAIDFAAAAGCGNLVFGCPRNRNLPDGCDTQKGVEFFKEIARYAEKKGTVIGMEANPPIYNTNFVNTTESAFELIEKVNSKAFALNLDLGTMIYNGEDLSVLSHRAELINHVHISEPGLKAVEKREIHKRLADFLKSASYNNYVSIEMGSAAGLDSVESAMRYVKEIFE